jgi:imidazolonepropionase-like amidohydrolase
MEVPPKYRFVFPEGGPYNINLTEPPVEMRQSILISRAKVVDAERNLVSTEQNIEIDGGRISTAVRDRRGWALEIDASGCYVCPGLIDSHVHLFLDGGAQPRHTFFESTDEAKLHTARANLLLALSAGITTVRDCGGPAALVFRVQRAVERGDLSGPRILAAGAPITRPKGHCHFFGIEVTSPQEIFRAVEQQARDGAAFVKLIASGGGLTPGTRPEEADLPLEIMCAATHVAHVNGMHVAAHCHAVESIVRAIEAGVDTIEHASFTGPAGMPQFDKEIASRIKGKGIVVGPTTISGIRIAQAIRASDSFNGSSHAVARLEARRHHLAKFCEAGVSFIAGTDCGVTNTPFDSLPDELDEYVQAGLSPADALRTATSASARYLGLPLLGQVKQGFIADLLLLPGNPLTDLRHLRNPLLVMKEGEVVLDRRMAGVCK